MEEVFFILKHSFRSYLQNIRNSSHAPKYRNSLSYFSKTFVPEDCFFLRKSKLIYMKFNWLDYGPDPANSPHTEYFLNSMGVPQKSKPKVSSELYLKFEIH
ncbi:bcl-2-like protein 15 [Platysternon megacephalum]|uniref:Bcl-2-like protein 15 n=1 Tax=Platysternon megacephalum TaxID=55544 RepID=A0A4D9E303_9SAUR|nr:bcl-2-like protein 15 [Platysternon megacephalum]